MKLSDYILDFLVSQNIKHVFTVTGGACAHMIDSFHGRKDISYICVQHEQAGAMAADGYSRVGPGLGTAIVTSGPGATNLLTGICCAWFDSTPCLFLTGQVNTFESRGDLNVRQVGFQETDIVSIARPVTKYAEMVTDPQQIRYQLEKAVFIAKSGRKGPVLLDIPMDVQRAQIDPKNLKGYVPEPEVSAAGDDSHAWHKSIPDCMHLIRKAQRPVILVGGGIRLSPGAIPELHRFIEQTGIPVVASWSGIDIVPHDHPLYIGQIGVYGARAANFTIQNSDLLISVGSRLDTRQTGGRPDTFARGAKKIIVDIDPNELQKRVKPDVPICADANEFLSQMNSALKQGGPSSSKEPWVNLTRSWKTTYPAILPEFHEQEGSVNAYVFMQELSKALLPDDVVVTDTGGNLTWTMQAFHVKGTQRVFSAMGNSPMGYSLPAAIGASIGLGGKRIICIIGDGGMQMNIQELQTIVHYKLPIKLFIMNNRSYGIIKQFQEMYFDGRYEATVKDGGYSCPDFVRVAQAYGLPTESITQHKGIQAKLKEVLEVNGSVVCEVLLEEGQKLIPKLEFSKPIEDQAPSLAPSELKSVMSISAVESDDLKKIEH